MLKTESYKNENEFLIFYNDYLGINKTCMKVAKKFFFWEKEWIWIQIHINRWI